MRPNRILLLALVLASMLPGSGCIHEEQSTCLVLSVGGSKGLAHAGAIDALNELGVEISCVYGNSMGAVVGSLYSWDPTVSPKSSVKRIFSQYRSATESEMSDQAVGGFLVGAALALLSGGTLGWETMLGTTAIGVFSVEEFDNRRFMRVLDSHFRGAVMDTLSVPFATSYQSKTVDSLRFVVAHTGNLAQAVARSANNPFIFSGTSMQHLDPGADRIAMTPIEDACAHFRPARVIAINVTGEKAHYTPIPGCEVTEIMVDTPRSIRVEASTLAATIDELYECGYRAVMEHYGK